MALARPAAAMNRCALFLVFALAACSDDDSDSDKSAPGDGQHAGDESNAGDHARSGGRVAEPGVSVIALTLPDQEPKKSRIQRIELDGSACTDADADEDAATSPSCAQNRAPELGAPLFEIDGLVYDELPEVFANDEVLLLIPYSDPDCNLSCGTAGGVWTFEGPLSSGDGGYAGPLPANMPCSTAEGKTYLGLYPGGSVTEPVELARGTVQYRVGVSDACGEAATREISGEIEFK